MEDIRKKFIKTALDNLEVPKYKLTEWQLEFLTNIRNLVASGIELSHKQYNTLQDLYQRNK